MSEETGGQEKHFWMKVATWTFGLWALMIPITGKMLIDGQRDLVNEQKALMVEFVKYREIDERRMAIFEERQTVIMKRIETIDFDHREGKNHK